MQIAITNPTTWPHVRRGGERFINELARFLGERGHAVTIISGKPGRGEVREREGYRTVCHRRLWHPSLARIGVLEFHAFFLPCLVSLLRGRYDVVLCCTFLDTWAAILARKLTGTPCVFWVNSLAPPVRYVRSLTLGGAVLRLAVRDADEVIALSGYMQGGLTLRFGRAGVRLPVPVDTARFALSRGRDHARPAILCAAALDDRRKGGRLLVKAFDRLKGVRPEALLHVSSAVSERTRTELTALVSPRWRGDVHFLGAGEIEDLPSLFGLAAISVLPSLWEAFGMVILESMATGTPVVGARHGAIPELISDDGVGRLFDPGLDGPEPTDEAGLARSMIEALELSRDPGTALRCRAHAERFGWSAVGPAFEALLARLGRRARPAPAAAR